MTRDTRQKPDILDRAAACVLGGGVLLVPTDTVFGLAVLPSNPEAIDRLYRLKARPRARNLPVMIGNTGQLDGLGIDRTDSIGRLLDSPFVPGALSIVAGLIPGRSPDWLAGRDEIAFRMPDDDFLRALIGRTGPLLVTSANRHGNPTPDTVEEVIDQLDGLPDLIVEGTPPGDTPSTLVNCRHDPVTFERVGAIPPADILAWLG